MIAFTMKRYLLLLPFVALLMACASFQSTSGKLLATTAQSVDAAMKGWAAYVVAGGATANQETQVRAIYAKYQATMTVATNAYVAALTSGDQSPWNAASSALTGAQASLLQLIQTLTTTPKGTLP